MVLGGLPYFGERRRAGCWKPGSRRDSRFLQKMYGSLKMGRIVFVVNLEVGWKGDSLRTAEEGGRWEG